MPFHADDERRGVPPEQPTHFHDDFSGKQHPQQAAIARDCLERYSGSLVENFQPYILLTNFPQYVHWFAETYHVPVTEGSMFKAAHCPKEELTILDFKIGSPAAAFVIDLISHLPCKASLLLGMCAGLRSHYKVGDYFMPIASIRREETSHFYFPQEVPAMANFLIQKAVTNVLDLEGADYHIGITYTANIRFWEFNEKFKHHLKVTRAQAYEMECATLFMASYCYKLPLGALLLISDLPMTVRGIKTKASSQQVFKEHMPGHVQTGIKILKQVREMQAKHVKGSFKRYDNAPDQN